MGIVKSQAYKNTAISYIGIAIGYVNLVLFYPAYLTTEQIGLFQLLIGISLLYSLVASLGMPSIIARYFPFHKSEDLSHNGFVYWVALFSLAGFIVSTLLFFIFKQAIIANYINKAPLFVSYYYYLVPLTFFTIFFNLLESFGKVIYHTIYSGFLREIVLRILTTVSILFLAKGWIDFSQFIVLYILISGLISLLLFLSLVFSGKFSYRFSKTDFLKIKNKEMISYGFYMLLAGTIYVLLQKIDIIMLGSMVGLSIVGVYSTFFNIATVITVPAKALNRITYQLIADSWKEKNMSNIAEIYSKTSILQMIAGCLLFIGILINKDNLLMMINKNEFTEQFDVFIIIGLSFLVDITGGLNGHIISTSHKYKLVTALIITTAIICIGLNYLLIPLYGGMGAALAFLITTALYNFCTWFYIKYRFKMQPFSSKHLLVLVASFICYMIGAYFWKMPNLYLDILIRSSITTLVFGFIIYYLKVSADLNEKVDRTFGFGRK